MDLASILSMLLQVSQTVLVSTMQDQLANLVHIILKHQREDSSYKVRTWNNQNAKRECFGHENHGCLVWEVPSKRRLNAIFQH